MEIKFQNISILISTLFLFLTLNLGAQNKVTWTGNTNSNWDNPENWQPNIIPSGKDIIIFNSNATVKLPSKLSVNAIKIQSGTIVFKKVKELHIKNNFISEGNLLLPDNSSIYIEGKNSFLQSNQTNANFIIIGNVKLSGQFNTSGNIILLKGTFNTESYNVSADKITISPEKYLMVLLNESLVEVNNWIVTSTDNLDFYAGDAHIFIKNKSGNSLKNLDYHSLSYKGAKASYSLNCSSTNATCHGLCDGTITVDLASGTPNYPVSIRLYYPSDLGGGYVDYNNINSLPYTISNLCGSAQAYTVKVTDSDGDAEWCNVYVLEPGEMIVADDDVQNVSCYGLCDGYVQINYIQNAQYPVSYQWSNGDTTDKADSLCADSVWVTVTDNNGCQKVFGYLITQPDSFYSDMSVTNPTCNGDCDGEATVTPHGGTSPYSYNWSTSDTDSTITNLCAAQYTVTVTDDNGCEIYDTANVVDPPALTISISGNDPTCNGSCDGDATATVSGGTTPYSYNWDNGDNTQTANNLCAGWHYVTVTDNNGCQAIDSIQLNDPPGMTLAIDSTNVSCNGACDGSATVNVSGGTSPYSYNWSNGETTQTISNLCADTYYVTVTDNDGCQAVDSVEIAEPPALTTSMSESDPSCNGSCDGSATVNVSGGTSPYSYSWSNGDNTQTTSNLCAGQYIVTVTDANNCQVTDTANITDPPALTDSISYNDPSCNGSCDGDATASPNGGTSPYSYSWSNGDNTQTTSNLCANTYYVTITDNNGCSITDSVTITDPPALSLSFSKTDASCNGSCDGSATANVNGGTSPYTYNWSNGDNTQTTSNLCAGTYSVTVTDANGCQIIDSVQIDEPSEITVSFNTTDASCNGSCDGSITANVSGGNSPYTYNWSNGGNTQTISNLCAGTYTLTVTDNNGCQKVDSATINEPTAITTSISTNDPQCNGGCDGDATVNANGGTSPYSYSWSNGDNTQTTSNLCAGQYIVTVTDANNCQVTDTAVINDPPGMNLSMSKTDVTCNGACDGTASVSVSGGTSPYSYNWDNGSTDSTANNLCAGWHYVTVTDNNGCQKTDSIEITEPNALSTSTSSNNPLCYGSCDGDATVNVSGGTTPYSYSWSNGDNTQTANNLCEGTYYVTVTDANGCQITDSVSLTQPDSISITFTSDNVSCNGNCDGSITTNVSGGTSPYTYNWNTGDNTPNISNLCAGTYTLTVTDNNGCQKVDSIEITEPPVLQDSISKVDASCNGTCDGSATANPSGGTTPYSYSWSNGDNTQTINNLCAGDYTVTITDANGCTIIDSVTINEPTAITTSISKTDVTCNGACNGTATVSVSGGTSPYTYLWDNNDTDTTADSLCAGWHYVTVTDNNGCQTVDSIEITEPTELDGYVSSFDYPTCPGDCDGDITVTPLGGTAPYSYSWNNGETSQTADSLCAGTYTVTITDNNGCTKEISFTLNDPSAISTSISTTDATCYGECNGYVNLSVNGGVTPYSYQWSNGATTEDISNACAGTYYVTVTDANGCQKEDSGTIAEPSQLVATLTINSNPTCNGLCDGDVSVNVSGGTTPYTYQWNNGVTDSNDTTLCEGNVSVTVTDANSCQVEADTVLIAPQVMSISHDTIINPSCHNSCNGIISISTSGGTTPYNYAWSSGQTTDSISSLCEDTFIVTVTDANNCYINDTIVLTAPPEIQDTFEITEPLCYGDCNGTITVHTTGGTPSYTFNWSNGGNDSTITSLCAGTYNLTITDNNGCAKVDSVILNQPDSLYGTFTGIEPLCYGDCNGSLTINTTGGTPPYGYQWNTSDTTSSISGICANNYSVSITDANGCQLIRDTAIAEPLPLDIQFTDSTYVTCFGECNGDATIAISGGTTPYSINWSNGDTTTTADNLCAGWVYVTVTDANLCSIVDSIYIDQPDSFYIQVDTVTEAYCGQCVAYIEVSAQGGTPAYSYVWNTGATTDSIGGLCPNIYTVTATDANGCTTSEQITVIDTSDMQLNLTVTDITCNGYCDGNIQTVVTGGTTPYTYSWNTGDTTNAIDSLCEGLYSVTVIDANNCTRVAQDSVTQTNELAYSDSITNILCNGQCNGAISITPSGGTQPYNILWETGSTTDTISSLCAGYYSFTITDANNCQKVDSIEIVEPDILSDTIYQIDSILCFGYNDGKAVVSVTGGTPPYSYAWDNGQTDDTLTNVTGGIYHITITDANGCTIEDSIEIVQPDSVVISFTDVNLIPCQGICTGHATVNVNGGTSPYTYNWSNGDTSITADSLCGGYTTISITDANGCLYTDSVAILDTSNLQADVISTYPPACYGDCNGSIVIGATGGYPPYSYQWDANAGSQTTDSIGSLCAGNYAVTITDDSGCYVIDTIHLNNPPQMVISLDTNNSSNLITCYQECTGSISVIVQNGVPPYNYEWSHDSTIEASLIDSLCAGNYSLTVTDSNGCQAFFDTTIISNGEITVSFDVTNPLCEYGSADGNIIANVSGGSGNYTYQWNTGDTTSSLINLDGGIYYLTVTDSIGCQQTDSAFLNPQILVVARADTDTTICPGDTIMIYGYTNGERFEWSPTTNMIDSLSLTPLVYPNDTTVYYFTAFDTICYNWDSVVVNVYERMDIDAGEDVEIISDQSTQLHATGGHQGCQYQWVPNSGLSNDTIPNPVADPDQTTVYYVIVTDEHGCTAMDSVKVTVIPQLVIPDGITPNGDGLNDEWVIDNIDLFPNVEIEIFNRWGELLFYSKGYPPSERWDGTYKGKKLPTGTYYYVIKLNDPYFPDPITGPITIMY